jgi:hypothetical protein
LPPRRLIDALLTAHKAGALQFLKLAIDRCSGDFAPLGEVFLRGETPHGRVVAVSQMPKQDLGGRAKPTLLDSPICCRVAHSVLSGR